MKLQLVVSQQTNPFLNLSVEEFLCHHADDDTVTMYLWKNRRTVVIGQNQNPFAECNVELLEREGGFLARRRTGGGAVYHDDGNLNFSFIAPPSLYSQESQFAVLQQAVQRYGLRTELSGRNDVLCYDAEGQARKFSGNAFSKGNRYRLHHGTILIRSNIDDLQRYLLVKPAKLQKHGVASVRSRVVNLSELADVTSDNIIPQMIEAFASVYHGTPDERSFAELSLHAEVQSLCETYASDAWRLGRWRTFQAQRMAQFPWGLVELSIDIDQEHSLIRDIRIATDSLNPNLSSQAEVLLRGASTALPPPLPPDSPSELSEILTLIY